MCSTSEVPIPEGERAKGAVSGGVAVAADDRHARLGEAELGADDVDDSLRPLPVAKSGTPNSGQFCRSASS